MPAENTPETTEYSETFASDIAAEIGSDLFSSEEKPAEVSQEPAEPSVELKDPSKIEVQPNPAVVQGQNSVGKPLPKSWKKDMAPHWEKLPPEVHEYVYAREADVMRGIQQYQQGYQQWDSLVKPFAPVLQQYPDVNPVQLMQGLMQTHLQLLDPAMPAAQKAQLAQKILTDYGISLDPSQQQTQPNAEVQALRQELLALKQGFTQTQQRAYQEGIAQQQKLVDDFASKNEFFEEVQNDIFRLLQTGAAVDLPSAYEQACWINPGVRQKLLAKQQTANAPAPNPSRKANGQFVNLDAAEPGKTRVKKGSIDDTINSIVASHYSTH